MLVSCCSVLLSVIFTRLKWPLQSWLTCMPINKRIQCRLLSSWWELGINCPVNWLGFTASTTIVIKRFFHWTATSAAKAERNANNHHFPAVFIYFSPRGFLSSSSAAAASAEPLYTNPTIRNETNASVSRPRERERYTEAVHGTNWYCSWRGRQCLDKKRRVCLTCYVVNVAISPRSQLIHDNVDRQGNRRRPQFAVLAFAICLFFYTFASKKDVTEQSDCHCIPLTWLVDKLSSSSKKSSAVAVVLLLQLQFHRPPLTCQFWRS